MQTFLRFFFPCGRAPRATSDRSVIMFVVPLPSGLLVEKSFPSPSLSSFFRLDCQSKAIAVRCLLFCNYAGRFSPFLPFPFFPSFFLFFLSRGGLVVLISFSAFSNWHICGLGVLFFFSSYLPPQKGGGCARTTTERI